MHKFTKEFKVKIINEYQKGCSYKTIHQKYGVSKTCLYDWIKLYKVRVHKDEKTFTYMQFEDLPKQFEKVSRELEIIKATNCLPTSSRNQKQEAIENNMDKFQVKEMCRTLGLPSGTFYNYHLRRVKVTQNQIRDEYLKGEIVKVFEESEQKFGSTKIATKLRTLGIITTQGKVYKLMKELNIKSKQYKKRSFIPEQGKLKFCRNLLKRQFTQTEPNKYWVGDITSIFVKSNKFYLCVIMELFSRKVIAYRLSGQNNNALTINTFKDAFESRNRPVGLCFHSDQETNYTSNEYRDLLHSLKVKQSFSNKSTPYDNACVEEFFSNFKLEEMNSHNFEFYDELAECVDSYLKYYNDYRPHDSLQNKNA